MWIVTGPIENWLTEGLGIDSRVLGSAAAGGEAGFTGLPR